MTEAQTKTRERRFGKAFFDHAGNEVDGSNPQGVVYLGVQVDGEIVKLDVEELSQEAWMRLALDGLYEKLTRSVHTAKPKAIDTNSAIEVLNQTFTQIKTGKFRKSRTGSRGPREFDVERFKNAVVAGAKGNGVKVSEEKLGRLLEIVQSMSGKDRQKYIQEKYMKDPYFKTAWEKPIIDKKKAALKSGEIESAFADLN